jgi:hypothetical protein
MFIIWFYGLSMLSSFSDGACGVVSALAQKSGG